MCGIAGLLSTERNIQFDSIVSTMLLKLRHRGPDDTGIYNFPTGAIGMRRLAIQDLSPDGHQPMFDSTNKVTLVFNGEIYNANTLRLELKANGYQFHSHSDTEVLLAMYLEYGEGCLSYIDGMFAFAILDNRDPRDQNKLLLVRDQIGIKPLYFAHFGNSLAFCSELTPFVAAGLIPPHVDLNSLRQLLNYGSVIQPNTILSSVKMLLPGHKMVFSGGNLSIERYWKLEDLQSQRQHKYDGATYKEITDEIEKTLTQSVRDQLISDTEVGAFLSGGIDSGLIVSLMSKISSARVKTFSIGFPTDDNYSDELARARLISNHIGTDHNELVVDSSFIKSRIERFATSLDQPSIDGINSFIVSELAAETIKVALSGTGGDELFAGYPWFKRLDNYSKQWATKIWQSNFVHHFLTTDKLLPLFLTPIGVQLDNARRKTSFLGFYTSMIQAFTTPETYRLIKHNMRTRCNWNHEIDFNHCDTMHLSSGINRVTGLTLNTYLVNQLLRDIDVCSMASSLEVRVPFLSLDVIGDAIALPDNRKLSSGDKSAPLGTYRNIGTKKILFEIAEKYLPKDFDLVPKSGFTLPMGEWLGSSLKEQLNDSINYIKSSMGDQINPDQLDKMLVSFENNMIEWHRPWLIMILGLWLKNAKDIYPGRALD